MKEDLDLYSALSSKKQFEWFGKLKRYDACTCKPLFQALFKTYRFKVFRFVGTSKIYYIYDRKQVSTKRYYFFVYRKKYERLRSQIICII